MSEGILKPAMVKKLSKRDREHKVLLGLVEYYLKTGKPVGSHSLQEAGFDDLSTATIRNYFARLESEGLLKQLHASGGRIPTAKAFRIYAQEYRDEVTISPEDERALHALRGVQTKEINHYLTQAAQQLSRMTHMAVFLSSPRFDHDIIADIKLVAVDATRVLCVLVTDFGVIKTEVLHAEHKLSAHTLKRMESYFHWRLRGSDKPENLSEEEDQLAQAFYNELMVRYVIGYSNFSDEEIYKTGFSELLHYPDFHDVAALTNSMALFENPQSMRLLLRDCLKGNQLKVWIGDDLSAYMGDDVNCSVVAVPYRVGQNSVGAFGVLGPVRIPYRQLFGILTLFSDYVSEALTRNLYKYKITFRQPQKGATLLEQEQRRLLGTRKQILLEDQRS